MPAALDLDSERFAQLLGGDQIPPEQNLANLVVTLSTSLVESGSTLALDGLLRGVGPLRLH
jgi:hypothetical protein